MLRVPCSLFVFILLLLGGLATFGQQQQTTPVVVINPPRPSIARQQDENDYRAPTIRETLEKMRIAKEKKDFDQMITRGGDVLKITEEIEKAYEQQGRLTPGEYSKIANVEKLVKKIREELGGDGDDGDKEEAEPKQSRLMTAADAIKGLRQTTAALFDELKKTTRFSISATAIQTSNAVLRLAKFLKVTN
jgi:hypothetical protein